MENENVVAPVEEVVVEAPVAEEASVEVAPEVVEPEVEVTAEAPVDEAVAVDAEVVETPAEEVVA